MGGRLTIIQNVYFSVSAVGLAFISVMMVRYALSDRRRNPVVLTFLGTAFISYWIAMFPLIGYIWQDRIVVGGDVTGDLPLGSSSYRICEANAILGSFLRTALPLFSISFTGELLSLLVKIWRATREITPRQPLRSHSYLRRSLAVVDGKNIRVEIPLENMPAVNWDDAMPVSPTELDAPLPPRRRLSMKERSLKRVKVLLSPVVLCILPFLLALLPFIASIVSVFTTKRAVIVDEFKCCVTTQIPRVATVLIITSGLTISLLFSVLSISFFTTMRRMTNKETQSQLDRAFIFRISLLSVLSLLGGSVYALQSWISMYGLAWVFDFYTATEPIFAALCLVEFQVLAFWKPAKSNAVSHQTSISSGDKSNVRWEPPQPSYERQHRPASVSTIATDFPTWHGGGKVLLSPTRVSKSKIKRGMLGTWAGDIVSDSDHSSHARHKRDPSGHVVSNLSTTATPAANGGNTIWSSVMPRTPYSHSRNGGSDLHIPPPVPELVSKEPDLYDVSAPSTKKTSKLIGPVPEVRQVTGRQATTLRLTQDHRKGKSVDRILEGKVVSVVTDRRFSTGNGTP